MGLFSTREKREPTHTRNRDKREHTHTDKGTKSKNDDKTLK